MTPIKFRAYDFGTGKFYFSNRVYDDHYFAFRDDTLKCFGENYECLPVEMFTGKLDEDEKEIYAGDIVDFTVFDCFGGDEQYRGCVVFTDGLFQLWNRPNSEFFGDYHGFGQDAVCYLKVIGNIHQNPELIEEGIKTGGKHDKDKI